MFRSETSEKLIFIMVSTSYFNSNELSIIVNNLCSQYSIDCFNDLNLNHDMIIFYQNIQLLNCNGDDFLLFLNSLSKSPSVIVLSESWSSESTFMILMGILATILSTL